MADMRQEILNFLDADIKKLLNPDLHCELVKLIKEADDHKFTKCTVTSLSVLKTFNVFDNAPINEEKLRWQSEDLLESLTDSTVTDTSIEDILIQLELLILPLINYKHISAEISVIESTPSPILVEKQEAFLSELMDAVLDDIAKLLEKDTDKNFDWFYEIDVFKDVIFRLRNPQLYKQKSNDAIDRIYWHIKLKLTKKYRLKQRQLAQLLVDQFHYIGPDTIRRYLSSFVQEDSDCSKYTLEEFFNFKPELKSVFDDNDMKRFKRLFEIYCKKLQTSPPSSSLPIQSNKASIDTATAQRRWTQHISQINTKNNQDSKWRRKRHYDQLENETRADIENTTSNSYHSIASAEAIYTENESTKIGYQQRSKKQSDYGRCLRSENSEYKQTKHEHYRNNNPRLNYYQKRDYHLSYYPSNYIDYQPVNSTNYRR